MGENEITRVNVDAEVRVTSAMSKEPSRHSLSRKPLLLCARTTRVVTERVENQNERWTEDHCSGKQI
jgi:hypothetical protein